MVIGPAWLSTYRHVSNVALERKQLRVANGQPSSESSWWSVAAAIRKQYNMTSSTTEDCYNDALAATASIENITEDEVHRETLRLLRDDDSRLSHLTLCGTFCGAELCTYADSTGDYSPGSSEELGWLGLYAKKSTHLEKFGMYGRDIFKSCSKQSVDRFFEDLRKCNHFREINFVDVDLAEFIETLGPKNGNITHWNLEDCILGVPGANYLSNAFQTMKSLKELYIHYDDDIDHGVDDDIMAGCIPSLAGCTAMRKLNLCNLGLSTNCCAALSAVFPRMTNLHELNFNENSIDYDCVEDLVRGLAECEDLHSLSFSGNAISDNGLAMLIRGLPASVHSIDLSDNGVTLARQLPLLRFKNLELWGNALSSGGPGVIAMSLANPECQLELLDLLWAGIIEDDGAATLAESLRSNERLTTMWFEVSNITETGWNAFSYLVYDTTSIDATYNSNHTLQNLGDASLNSQHVQMLLELNSDEDKCRVAANKILRAHRHLDMRPFFSVELNLLPCVITWLERFAETRLDLKLSSMFEFVRAMPMNVVERVAGKKKGEKRWRNSS